MSEDEFTDPNEVICDCSGTTLGKIQQLIERGENSLERIGDITGAATGCGSCDAVIENILKTEKQS